MGAAAGLIQRGVVRIAPMKPRIFEPSRREVLAGLGASVAGLLGGGAAPVATTQLALQARPATLALKPDQPPAPIWELAAASHLRDVRLRRGDRCEVVFRNDLPVPLAPVWYGLNGPVTTDPLRGRAPAPPNAVET